MGCRMNGYDARMEVHQSNEQPMKPLDSGVKALLPDSIGEPATLPLWEKQRLDIRRRLFETIGEPPVPRNTRDIETLEDEPRGSYQRKKLRYVVAEGDVVHAYLLIPQALQGPTCAAVAMHQTTPLGKREVAGIAGDEDFAYGHELAELGYVVLIPDYLTAGERVYAETEPFDSAPFYAKYPNWSMVGKNLEDSMAAVDVLTTLPDVDPRRIVAIGHSHGGHNAIFAAALDDRVAACVSNCGLSVFSEEENRMDWCDSAEGSYNYIPSLKVYFDANQSPPFDLHEIAALIAPRPWLNVSAYMDRAYGNQAFLAEAGVMLNAVYELYGRSMGLGFLMHRNNHSFPRYARELAYSFLNLHL